MALSEADARRDDGLTRRALLKGAAGAALALPFLESWPLARRARAGEPKPPLRLVFVMVPNGVHMPDWTPRSEGPDFELPPLLEPLAPHRKKLLVLSGLAVSGADAHGDGPGDHARAGASYLTCAHPRKTGGADIQVGVSVDQVAAKTLGQATRFPSLELGTEPSAQGGSCDSGYSCSYSSNLAWSGPATPLAKEIVPRRAFDRLFRDGAGLTAAERARRDKLRASLLDAVKEDANAAKAKLGETDRKKLDELLDAVRDVEKRLSPPRTTGETKKALDLTEPPAGVPEDYGEHIRRLYDVIHLALATDSTRVVTFMCGNEGSNRGYRALGVPEGHHDLSHHGRDKAKQAKIAKINRFHTEQLAYFLSKLESTKEGSGTLLDRTLVVWGSAIGDGDAHNHDELPIILAGAAGGVATGRHVRYPRGTPLASLYLYLLKAVGCEAESFADSKGVLPRLTP